VSSRLTRRTVLAAGIGALAAAGTGWAAMAAETPRTRTRKGVLRGFVRNGASVFLGIPYGASTAGERRFLPPTEPAAWSGERDATQVGQRAPQAAMPVASAALPVFQYFTGGRYEELRAGGEAMGEDCLVLNVLTPRVDKAGRPVLVYVHGGGFVGGSGNVMTASDRLVMEEDIVVVTVNHRLGALGFLYLGGLSTRFAAGNVGMLDLVAALRWVRDNIAEFGGDPDKVTLFGESGGGAKIALLNAMPQAKGLFRGVIVQSGLLATPAPPTNDAAASVLRELELASGDVSKLQAMPVDRLLGATGPGIATWPVADGMTLKPNPWQEAPSSMLRLPMITGYCADEATIISLAEFAKPLEWHALLARLSERFAQPEASIAPVVQAYRHAYATAGPVDIYSRMLSDCSFGRDMVHLADLKAKHEARVYFYRMEYIPPTIRYLRAFHTVELPLVGRMVVDPNAEALSRQLAGAWAAFARSADPNDAGLPHWPPRPTGGANLMQFSEASRFGADPQATARAALNRLVGDAGRQNLLHPMIPATVR
jgi:para-nitrobenzyl esterase